MNQTTFQPAEIYDSNGNIIQQGAYGINTPFCTSTGDGVYDYIVNNLNALKDMIAAGYIAVATLPSSGDANKYYVITEGANAGKCYVWTGSAWQELTTQINGKSAYEIAVDHGFIGTEQQWLDSFTADAIAAANRAEAAMETIEAGLETLEGIDARFANIEDHAEMTDSNVDATKKRISNVEKLLQGNLYDYQTDETVAYEKTVPSGAMPYAGIEKIGGKTVVWNQIFPSLNATNLTVNSNAGTMTDNGDGTVTYTMTTETSYAYFRTTVEDMPLMISGHKYYTRIDIKTPGTQVSMRINNSNGSLKTWSGLTANTRTVLEAIGVNNTSETNPAKFIYPTWITGATGECILYSVTLVDLTLMFGAGNEPSTVAEFETMFPASYYPYNAGTLLSAGVTSVVSKDSNDDALQTLSIPAEVQALDGYGWSAGTAYNYIDYERKVFVKNVASITLNGTETWTKVPGGTNKYFFINIGNYGTVVDHAAVSNTLETKVVNASNTDEGVDIINSSSYNTVRIIIRPPGYTEEMTVAEMTTWITNHPTTVHYALSTPIETDISAYLSDDNLIEVKSGGTLIMYSDANGDDDAYHIPVPSTVEYMIDLNVATGGTENEP